MSKELTTTFIMPAYNEERSITRALESLANQKLDDINMRIVVVANGCSDQTAQKAEDFAKLSRMPIQVVETEVKQKGNAINLGRANTDDSIVIYGDADCVFHELAITKIVRELSNTDQYAVVGGLDVPNFENSDPASMLCEFQKIMQVERIARGRVLAIGRLIGFNQDKVLESFPTDIHSEDIWITLHAAKKYEFKAVKVLLDAKVYYQPPLTWNDFLAQETRYEMSMDQLFDKYPDLHPVYNNRRGPFTPEIRDRIEQEIEVELSKLGINQEKRHLLHSVFDKVVEENAKYYLEGFMKGNGDWKPVSTTK